MINYFINCRHVGGLIGAVLVALSAGSGMAEAQGSLSVEKAVELALTRNERSQSADLIYSAARARVRRGWAAFLPEVSVTTTYRRRDSDVTRDVGGETFYLQRKHAISPLGTATLNLFDARAIAGLSAARNGREAARYGASEVKRELSFDVTNGFMICLSAKQLLEAALRRQDFANRSLLDASARFDAQLVSSNDVTRAQLEVATADRQVTRAKGDLERAYLDLGYLIGMEVEGGLEEPEGLRRRAEALIDEAPRMISAAETRRGDVLESQFRARSLKASAREPLLRMLPRLEVNGNYRLTNEGGLEDQTREWWLGGRIVWDILDGGGLFAERAERSALARAAELDAQALARSVSVDARSALADLQSARAAVDQAAVAVSVGQTNARQTAELYRQGLAGALEAADANVSLFEAEVAHVRERYGLILSVLGLNESLGLDPFSREPVR